MGAYARALRTQRGLVQEELAHFMGDADVSYLSRFECGNVIPSNDYLARFIGGFGRAGRPLLISELLGLLSHWFAAVEDPIDWPFDQQLISEMRGGG